MTKPLFRDDAYLVSCNAQVLEVKEHGGIVLDQTVFYAAGGGQPGDSGRLQLSNGEFIQVKTTLYSEDKKTIIHMPEEGQRTPEVGAQAVCQIDWGRRYKLMRVHTALHLLSVALPFPVTGGQINEGEGRLDFDMGSTPLDKDVVAARLNNLSAASYDVRSEWMTDDELDANPDLIKTMSVKPPRGSGYVRLIRIGKEVDLQPCGGTHVRNTDEIGPIVLGKSEKKGKQNRRVRIRLTDPSQISKS